MRNCAQVGASLRHGNSVSNAPKTAEIMACSSAIVGKEFTRNPGSNAHGKIKARRHDSHDGINPSVQGQVELGKVRLAAEIALPIAVAYDHRPGAVLALLLRDKAAPEKRFNAERLEEATGNRGDVNPRRLTPAGNGCGLPKSVFREIGKCTVLFLKILEVEFR